MPLPLTFSKSSEALSAQLSPFDPPNFCLERWVLSSSLSSWIDRMNPMNPEQAFGTEPDYFLILFRWHLASLASFCIVLPGMTRFLSPLLNGGSPLVIIDSFERSALLLLFFLFLLVMQHTNSKGRVDPTSAALLIVSLKIT